MDTLMSLNEMLKLRYLGFCWMRCTFWLNGEGYPMVLKSYKGRCLVYNKNCLNWEIIASFARKALTSPMEEKFMQPGWVIDHLLKCQCDLPSTIIITAWVPQVNSHFTLIYYKKKYVWYSLKNSHPFPCKAEGCSPLMLLMKNKSAFLSALKSPNAASVPKLLTLSFTWLVTSLKDENTRKTKQKHDNNW